MSSATLEQIEALRIDSEANVTEIDSGIQQESETDRDEKEIARLAALPDLQYSRERREAAEHLGCRVATLDSLVKNAKPARSQ